MKVFILLSILFVALGARARSWTDVKGRTIEAELLRVSEREALFLHKGRKVSFPIDQLCEADQAFIREGDAVEPAAPPAAITAPMELFGTPLRANGRKHVVEKPLSEEVIDEFASESREPSTLKICIALPEGFNPDEHQRVIWISGAINSDKQRRTGNIGGMNRFYATAIEAGWVVIAVDTDLGNPRPEDNQRSAGGDLAVQTAAVAELSAAWPEFKNWEFVCAGHSGGAKASFYRMGDLLISDLKVIGLYLAGCNENMTDAARDETDFDKSDLRDINVWISNGEDDPVSTEQHARNLSKSVKSSRFGEIHLELHPGDHEPDMDAFRAALTWYLDEK